MYAGRRSNIHYQDWLARTRKTRHDCDRFIPNRAALDMDYARCMLTAGWTAEKDGTGRKSPTLYQKRLAEVFNMNGRRILTFQNKPPTPVELFPQEMTSSSDLPKPIMLPRNIPQAPARVLDAPGIVDDFYLNLLDWSSSDILAIALENTVYLWNAANSSTSELVTIDEEDGPVTSLSWAPDGSHIAVGLNNSDVQLWDYSSNRKLRTLQGGHQGRVGSLDWNKHILTTGGMDGRITNNDVRLRSSVVETYRGHRHEVCGLKWSASGRHLASGGNDNLVHIWDNSMSTSRSNRQRQWLHRLEDHTAAIKALSWCPFNDNLFASGGGGNDKCIKFWNANTGACLNSVNTGSQVCALLWNKNERELISAHGLDQNQLTLWSYPSMTRKAELTGHSSRVLFMAHSPNGCTVASASGDETLRFWNVFGTPKVAKRSAPKPIPVPFSQRVFIR